MIRGGLRCRVRIHPILSCPHSFSSSSSRPALYCIFIFDTAALLTMQIRNLWAHLSRCKKDVANIRSLRVLVHKRAKILRYLKKTDADRYERVLGRLGLEAEAVEGELNI